jgi:hypothetical protein
MQIEMWSPLLSETLTWFWTRWCRSYLLRNDHSSPTLAQEFGVESPNAYNLVNFLFQKVNQNLIYWTGEEDILKEVILLTFHSQSAFVNLKKVKVWAEVHYFIYRAVNY